MVDRVIRMVAITERIVDFILGSFRDESKVTGGCDIGGQALNHTKFTMCYCPEFGAYGNMVLMKIVQNHAENLEKRSIPSF